MSLQAQGAAQSLLVAQSPILPSSFQSDAHTVGSSSGGTKGEDIQPAVVEVPHGTQIEGVKDLGSENAHLGVTTKSGGEPSSLKNFIFPIRLFLGRLSASIWQDIPSPEPRDTAIGPAATPIGKHETEQTKDLKAPQGQVGHDEDDKYLYDTGHERYRSPFHWKDDNRTLSDIPQYVLDYAPYVYLFSGEQFWPCDIAEHLNHVTPNLNYTPIFSKSHNMNLTNLDKLNEFDGGRFVYLKSDDDVEERPDWLGGQQNIPDEPGEDLRSTYLRHPHQRPYQSKAQEPPTGGRSSAPAFLVTVNKGHGIVDAFWFYFYSYNLGNKVLNVRFGNHIGDWEHSLIRFQHGKPKIVFFSEHFFGQAYTYEAVEKIGQRPVVYSAVGTHAMYATPGIQPYILPLGLLHDQTDRGPLWDPALNTVNYVYNVKNDTLTPDGRNPDAPTEWFFFDGHWGDRYYPMDDSRQYQFFGQYHYVTGPLGPRWKHLGRRKVCQGPYSNECIIKQRLEAEGQREIPVYPGPGKGEGEDDDH